MSFKFPLDIAQACCLLAAPDIAAIDMIIVHWMLIWSASLLSEVPGQMTIVSVAYAFRFGAMFSIWLFKGFSITVFRVRSYVFNKFSRYLLFIQLRTIQPLLEILVHLPPNILLKMAILITYTLTCSWNLFIFLNRVSLDSIQL